MLNVYLSGEIHSDWRDEIIKLCRDEDLSVNFSSPNTDHESSDNCGVEILGGEDNNYWKDNNSNLRGKIIVNPHTAYFSEEALMESRTKACSTCLDVINNKYINNRIV